MTIQYQLEGPEPPGKHSLRAKRTSTVLGFFGFIQKFPYEEYIPLSLFEADQAAL